MESFDSLDLVGPLSRALKAANYETPTPIQARAIPPLLEGRDVLGCAQTGTGKTAAFLLPVINHLMLNPQRGRRQIRALILTPTRELASQIGESFATYAKFTKLRHRVIFGGVGQRPQVDALNRGVDVLIATPGRLLDLYGQGHVKFEEVEFFVLDEADRMLDMGFIHDIRRVIKALPQERQNLLFSATMPKSIVELASGFLTDPIQVEVAPQSTTAERIDQSVMFVERANKRRLLRDIMDDKGIESAIVFTRTKHGANRVADDLTKSGVEAMAIHGNKSQSARERALAGFRDGKVRVLVATDIASRGIDIDNVSHVINFDLPNEAESYVHRIGRTGRAGREGIAIAFCDETEGGYLRDIERLTGQEIEVDEEHGYHHPAAIPPMNARGKAPKRGGNRGGGGNRRNDGGGRPRGGGNGGGGGGRNRNRRGRPSSSANSGGRR